MVIHLVVKSRPFRRGISALNKHVLVLFDDCNLFGGEMCKLGIFWKNMYPRAYGTGG